MSAQIFRSAMADQSRITGTLHHVRTDAFEKTLAMVGIYRCLVLNQVVYRPSKDRMKNKYLIYFNIYIFLFFLET